MYEILNKINGPEDVKKLNIKELENLAEDIRVKCTPKVRHKLTFGGVLFYE